MKTWKNKSKLSAIAFVTILTFAATFVTLPIVSAHEPAWEVPNWAYISVTNNPMASTQPAPAAPELTEAAEAPVLTTELIILSVVIIVVAVIVSLWLIRKRRK
ncbi:MAG: hypothetical protein CW716_00465 [Candidatus Bathyarchaeum sp.]|nr:MAG: hypothetical protein CW716_00465 [Candidatus Bathyarchaeum sp.]